uniref:Uncharacterized protein n=1 Tax=viral metagenome TaxID=1070528 RepID=A0A6M3INS8_9ZZZZ
MALSDLPKSGSSNFEVVVRNTIHSYRNAIDTKAANTHTHGTYGGVSMSLVSREANLGVGAIGGELSSTTQEYGNMYTWNADGNLWQPHSGNYYSSVSLPAMGTYQNVTGTLTYDLTNSETKEWNGSSWGADFKRNKNAIINGDFNIWQRGTSFAAIANGIYSADRIQYFLVGTAVHTISRATDVPTQSESGHKSNYSLKVDCTTVDATIAAGDAVAITHKIEGYNFAPFMSKTATLSFWVKAVKTGIYCIAFQNSVADRSYVAEYTISSASTWEKKTVTLTFSDSGGTWDYTNGTGLSIFWALAAGTDFQGVADTWNTANDLATSNQVNGVDHTDNNFWLSQVQFEIGSVATDFEYRQFGDEFAKCRRYYQLSYSYGTYPGAATSNGAKTGSVLYANTVGSGDRFVVDMRAAPTVTIWNPDGTSGEVVRIADNVDIAATAAAIGTTGFANIASAGLGTIPNAFTYNWEASAEL